MQSSPTRSTRHCDTELCIGVISTFIDIAVAFTCTQTREGGEVFKALKNDPETRQPPRTLSLALPLSTRALGVWTKGKLIQ
jgi:hypothetical protein